MYKEDHILQYQKGQAMIY